MLVACRPEPVYRGAYTRAIGVDEQNPLALIPKGRSSTLSRVVIAAEIRVFQQYRRIAEIAAATMNFGWSETRQTPQSGSTEQPKTASKLRKFGLSAKTVQPLFQRRLERFRGNCLRFPARPGHCASRH